MSSLPKPKLIMIPALLILCYFNLLANGPDSEFSTTEQSELQKYTTSRPSLQDFRPSIAASSNFQINNKVGKLLLWDISSKDVYSDREHNIGLFVFNEDSSSTRENKGIELSNLQLVFLETQNQFADMKGSVNLITIINDNLLFHVNLYSTLSGSGHMSSTTDLVVSVAEPKFEPVVLFDLGKTGYFYRTGPSLRSYENTRFRLATRHSKFDSLLLETDDKSRSVRKCIVLRTAPGIEECELKDIKAISDITLNRAFDRFLESVIGTNMQ